MFDPVFESHIRRVRAAVLQGYSLAQIPEWVERHTVLRGQPFSFKDHEFQLKILKDTSPQINVRKCSQIGMSELSVRMALSMVNIMDDFTVIYTLPTAGFARTFSQTRIGPVIQGSPEIKYRLSTAMDNAEVKQFGLSFLYIKGTVGQGAAISVPADALIHDELDFSENDVVTTYQSRLTHSAHKITWKFSTPTVDGRGISAEMETSRRHFNMCKCNHCNEWFLPDYFQHVRVPKFKGELHEITKESLQHYRYKDTWLECPRCGERPSLAASHRQWVCENSDDQFDAAGYQIQPFDAPRIITPGDIVKRSTEYSRYVDFINFGLGKPAEDKDSSITKEDIDACYVPGAPASFFTHVMGVDMGLICHVMVAGVDTVGRLLVVKTERIPLARCVERLGELRKQYRVMMTVMDTVPYVETVMRMQRTDPNLWGALYVDMKEAVAYAVKRRDGDVKEGTLDLRQVNVNRNKALDSLMQDLRTGQIFMLEDDNRQMVTSHLQDMKRVKDFTQHHDLQFVWKKSNKGADHFHHTLLYAWVAAKMRGATVGGAIALPLLSSFKLKTAIA